ENPKRAWMDRERVAVLGRPLVHVDDLHTDPVLLQEQGRDETDRTGADDENLRIGVMKHRGCSPCALRKNCDPEADPAAASNRPPRRPRSQEVVRVMVNGRRTCRAPGAKAPKPRRIRLQSRAGDCLNRWRSLPLNVLCPDSTTRSCRGSPSTRQSPFKTIAAVAAAVRQ